ncbi:MAG TPA: AI-2E family transporter [Gemmatimonadales bacterium]|nr:AI-2E family transporter [Gemmatimonadales bacterium]
MPVPDPAAGATVAVSRDDATLRLTDDPAKAGPPRGPALRLSRLGTAMLVGIFTLLAIAALRYAASVLIPITIALLLSVLLSTPTKWLSARGVSHGASAAIVVFGTWLLLGLGVGMLLKPATEWVGRAPEVMEKFEGRVRKLTRPFKALQKTAETVEAVATGETPGARPAPTVKVQQPGVVQRLSGSTLNVAGAMLAVMFLTYFLVSVGPRTRRKVAAIAGRERQEVVEAALVEIEVQTARYLLYSTIVSVGVGTVTWVLLTAVKMPNAGLWAAVAAVLNYVPYVGAIVTLVLLVVAGLVTFEGAREVMIIAGGFFALNMLEGNLVTPWLLGRKLPLNPVSIFVGLLFWGWLWGVAGAVLAVPLMVLIKIVCDHVPQLKGMALLLDS